MSRLIRITLSDLPFKAQEDFSGLCVGCKTSMTFSEPRFCIFQLLPILWSYQTNWRPFICWIVGSLHSKIYPNYRDFKFLKEDLTTKLKNDSSDQCIESFVEVRERLPTTRKIWSRLLIVRKIPQLFVAVTCHIQLDDRLPRKLTTLAFSTSKYIESPPRHN
jgi:hypothetical protein